MRFRPLFVLPAVLIAGSCRPPNEADNARCDRAIVGNELGSGTLSVYLMIPRNYMRGAEIRNGGVVVFGKDCSRALDAMMSEDTVIRILDDGKNLTFNRGGSNFALSQAKIDIWKYRNKEGEIAFFVLNAFDIAPVLKVPSQFREASKSIEP